MKSVNSKFIRITLLIIVLSIFAWYVKPVRYTIIGVGYKVGIFKCPGFLDLMPRIDDSQNSHRDRDLENVIKKNCTYSMIVY